MSITQTETGNAATGAYGLSGEGAEVVLSFASGLPGFESSTRFRLEEIGAQFDPFCRIRSVTEPEICFTLVAPGLLFPDYTIEIDEEHANQLELATSEDAVVLAIVTLSAAPQPPSLNLLGPLAVNRRTWAAAQVVQYQSDYGTTVPIPVAAGPVDR